MKKTISCLLSGLLIAFMMACDETTQVSDPATDQTADEMSEEEALIQHGNYLVTMIGCDDCHTPKKMTDKGPVPDWENRLMGHPADMSLPEVTADMYSGTWMYMTPTLTAAVGPWGVSYAANLTSDESGIGNWSYENFKNAMTKGMHKGMEGTRPLMPPMPWQAFKEMKEADMEAIFAFLQSTKPIANVVPAYSPPTGNGE